MRDLPPFYKQRLRALTWHHKGRYGRGVGEEADWWHEAVAAFLAEVSPQELEEPSERVWQRARAPVLKALTRFLHAEEDVPDSLEDHPGLLEALQEAADDPSSWLPFDKVLRERLLEACMRQRKTKGWITPPTPPKRNSFSVEVKLLGKRVRISGGWRSRDEAKQGRDEFLDALIDRCRDISAIEDSGNSAERFLALHSGRGPKPTKFYGDPLEVLLYLEEFAQVVVAGHRYWTGDVAYEIERAARR